MQVTVGSDSGRGDAGIARSDRVHQFADLGGRRDRDQVVLGDGIRVIQTDRGQFTEGGAEVVGRQGGDRVDQRHPVAEHAAKGGEAAVLGVEIGRVVVQIDEELVGRAVWIVAQFGHGERATGIRVPGLVDHGGELLDRVDEAVSGLGQREAAGLDDEAGNRAMHDRVGVETGIDVGEKVGDRRGRGPGPVVSGLIEEFGVDVFALERGVGCKPHHGAGDAGEVEGAVEIDRRASG